MLFTELGRSVWEKNCALGLEYVLKTSGTVFSHTDLPPGKVLNVHIHPKSNARCADFRINGKSENRHWSTSGWKQTKCQRDTMKCAKGPVKVTFIQNRAFNNGTVSEQKHKRAMFTGWTWAFKFNKKHKRFINFQNNHFWFEAICLSSILKLLINQTINDTIVFMFVFALHWTIV